MVQPLILRRRGMNQLPTQTTPVTDPLVTNQKIHNFVQIDARGMIGTLIVNHPSATPGRHTLSFELGYPGGVEFLAWAGLEYCCKGIVRCFLFKGQTNSWWVLIILIGQPEFHVANHSLCPILHRWPSPELLLIVHICHAARDSPSGFATYSLYLAKCQTISASETFVPLWEWSDERT
jgi:hypothetical protein